LAILVPLGLGLLFIGAGVIRHVVPSPAPTTLGDRLLEELISLNAISDHELSLLNDRTSAQSRALSWLRDDDIATSQNRSPLDLLQRYVLAVLYFATSGGDWQLSDTFLSSNDVCLWNNGAENNGQGVYCRGGGRGIDLLNLAKNNLQGSLPRELMLLTNLEEINLDSNLLSGTIPAGISQLAHLKYFYASYNYFTGALPSFASYIKNIYLIQNQIGGTIPHGWGKSMPNLQNLSLKRNALKGSLPTTLGKLTSLYTLDLSDNQCNGAIPSELGQLIFLEKLDFCNNLLTGTIPSELGSLRWLESVLAANNQLTGTIPSELGQLPRLKDLSMTYNRLSGTIPTELGQLSLLIGLFLGSNHLTGTIPSDLGKLSSMGSLWINDNHLTGTIPTELAGISSIAHCDFSKNSLTGSLDESFCTDNRSWQWLGADCDEVAGCTCCTFCCKNDPPTCEHVQANQQR
jgi:hypothetical protein